MNLHLVDCIEMTEEKTTNGAAFALTDSLCRLGRHAWGKYRDFAEGTISFNDSAMTQPILVQEKRCIKCNAASRRLVKL